MPFNLEGPKAESEIAKQIITLSTGAVAFTVTFIDKFHPTPRAMTGATGASTSVAATADQAQLHGLYVAWVLFGLSIGFALWYLMALTGSISALGRKENGWRLTPAEQRSVSWDERNTRRPGMLMIGSFLFAVVSMIWVGFNLS